MFLPQFILVALTLTSLAVTPYKNLTIGIEILLPTTGRVVATSNNPPSCMVKGGNERGTWHLRLDRVLDTQQRTPQELVHFAFARNASPEGTTIIEDRSINIGVVQGWWLRTSLPIDDAQDSTLCWLAMPFPGGQALMASILTTNDGWDLHGTALLSSLETIQVMDPAKILTDRLEGLDQAISLLSDLSATSLDVSIDTSSWRRIQQFNDGDIRPTDIGYARIQSRIGNKSEIGSTNSDDTQLGLIVEVHSRLIPDQISQIVTDTTGYYWMSFDGKEERWSSVSTRWKGEIRTSQQETGILQRPSLGNPNPKLLILRQDTTSNRQLSPIEVELASPWLPKTLTWVIGHWLAETRPAQLSWRTLNDYIDPPHETMRSDNIESTANGFTVTTRLGDSDVAIITEYDNEGKLLRRELGEGIVIFGTDERTLRSIWEPKKLW